MLQPASSLIKKAGKGPFSVVAIVDVTAAERRIAGVSAIGRVVREIAGAGIADIYLRLPQGAQLGEPALDDIARLAPESSVNACAETPPGDAIVFAPEFLLPAEAIAGFVSGKARELVGDGSVLATRSSGVGIASTAEALRLDRRAGRILLRRTVKSGDGIVSRWINRRVSRPISAFLLLFPFIRPIHATVGTALIGVAMVVALLTGSYSGMVAGAILFQFASIFDGVDGEIARVTFRSSTTGASLDSAIDMATNIAFIIGLTYSMTMQGVQAALYLGLWSLGAMTLGIWLIGRRTVQSGKPLGFDLVKQKMREGNFGIFMKGAIAFFTMLTSRDGFAFLFAVLVATGLALVSLVIFASVALIWIVTVFIAILPKAAPTDEAGAAEEAASVR